MSDWVMPEWMGKYRSLIEEGVMRATAEDAMSHRCGAPEWIVVKSRVLLLEALKEHNLIEVVK